MVKICRGLYFNPLTAAFFIVCFLNGRLEYFLLSYISMLIHELAHLCAAEIIGLKPSHISLHPFGVNLHLKNTFVCCLTDEIILYLSGPLANLFIALSAQVFFKNFSFCQYLFAVNIALFAVNMLPVYPLDGGCMVKKKLSYLFGEHTGNIIIKAISLILGTALFSLGIYASYMTGFNYSVLFISVLIIGNIFTMRQKYSEAAVKSMIFKGKDKRGKKIVLYSSDKSTPPAVWRKYINPRNYLCIAIVDESGKISEFITEEEILNGIN